MAFKEIVSIIKLDHAITTLREPLHVMRDFPPPRLIPHAARNYELALLLAGDKDLIVGKDHVFEPLDRGQNFGLESGGKERTLHLLPLLAREFDIQMLARLHERILGIDDLEVLGIAEENATHRKGASVEAPSLKHELRVQREFKKVIRLFFCVRLNPL